MNAQISHEQSPICRQLAPLVNFLDEEQEAGRLQFPLRLGKDKYGVGLIGYGATKIVVHCNDSASAEALKKFLNAREN